MSVDRSFVNAVERYLDEEAGDFTPAYADRVLAQTATTRQRSWWSSPERWLPMDLTMRRPLVAGTNMRTLAILAVIGLLIAAIAAYAVGTQHRLPPPFGLAAPGLIGTGLNGDLSVANPDGTGLRTIVTGPDQDEGINFSRDGTRIVFNRLQSDGTSMPMTADANGGGLRPLVDRPIGMAWWFDWSPAGDQVAIAYDVGGHSVLVLVRVDDPGNVRTLEFPGIDSAGYPTWRAPDGREIVFVGNPAGGPRAQLYRVHADGTGLVPVGPAYLSEYILFGLQVSPDGRLALYWNIENDSAGGTRAPRIHEVDLDTGDDHIA